VTRVLVVDDDPRLQRTLTIALRAHGNEVVTAADGRTAVQSVTEDAPDVVILDLGLPDLDGTEVLRRIRAASVVPVIVLSARHESDDKIEALDLGADDYVTKPFGVEELLARVRAAVRRGGDLGRHLGPVVTDHFVLDFAERRATVEGEDVPHPNEPVDAAELDELDDLVEPAEPYAAPPVDVEPADLSAGYTEEPALEVAPQRTASLVAERGEQRAHEDETAAVPTARWTPGDLTRTVDEDDEESEDAWNLTDRGGRERY